MLLEDPWECFLCRDKSTLPVGLLHPRPDWKERFLGMFRTTSDTVSNKINIVNNGEKKGIRVLSLFDGLSTGKHLSCNLYIIIVRLLRDKRSNTLTFLKIYVYMRVVCV